ncbi:stealth conserved region 3 domain-containing protein [Paeniglutamicibacter cryotolerans]|uniref:Sugar phosphotransferase n=1 Tax=Paeniglutamicibacter cryotolerans TaxID=670079 RepID=A0A839QRW4_9MICC|nr:stealth conserved region 3 domain-containing protein [Paeniglutamicibacter cryotolerans]MBB2997415.1 hypothetical protein [Paeniglutamicibacter cryotolerans]
MDFSRKPPNAERGLNALRDEQTRIVRRIVIESDTPCVVSDDGRTLTMTAAACARLREQLAERGIDSLSIEADALSRNIIAGWSCADKAVSLRQRDLHETLGVRILVTGDGKPYTVPNILDFDAPVDLVYTWVDGADAQWQDERAHALAAVDTTLLPTAADAVRYSSNDELKYSLRSVEAFLPWVNHIYLVMGQQPPVWLNTDHPGLTVVDHAEIFANTGNLPTFNSHAIEAQLHRIRELSEHFIYMNDDVFFGKPVSPSLFFTRGGQTRFQLSTQRFETEVGRALPVDVAALNNSELLQVEFGVQSTLKFKHVAHPQRRSVLERIEARHPVEVATTVSSKFRGTNDLSIPSSLAHYYGAALGMAVPGDASYKYVDVGEESAQLNLAKLLWGKRPHMLCLNQVSGGDKDLERQRTMVTHYLRQAYPWRSSFERVP